MAIHYYIDDVLPFLYTAPAQGKRIGAVLHILSCYPLFCFAEIVLNKFSFWKNVSEEVINNYRLIIEEIKYIEGLFKKIYKNIGAYFSFMIKKHYFYGVVVKIKADYGGNGERFLKNQFCFIYIIM